MPISSSAVRVDIILPLIWADFSRSPAKNRRFSQENRKIRKLKFSGPTFRPGETGKLFASDRCCADLFDQLLVSGILCGMEFAQRVAFDHGVAGQAIACAEVLPL